MATRKPAKASDGLRTSTLRAKITFLEELQKNVAEAHARNLAKAHHDSFIDGLEWGAVKAEEVANEFNDLRKQTKSGPDQRSYLLKRHTLDMFATELRDEAARQRRCKTFEEAA